MPSKPEPEPDLSEFEALSSRSQCNACAIPMALADMTPAERVLFTAAMDRSEKKSVTYISPGAISKWLVRHGHKAIHFNVIGNHRNKHCGCYRV